MVATTHIFVKVIMLRACVNDPENPMILVGLSEGNIERLKAGLPILADLRSFGVDLPGRLGIIYGRTEADIEAELRKAGLITAETRGSTDPRVDQEAAARAEHRHILIATLGLPRSGKTTWARSQAYPIVNPDSIRLALHGQRFVGLAERFVWATAHAMVRALFLAGHRHVIFDATNTTRKRRDELASPEWGTFFRLVDTSADVCRERARSEGDTEILPVIDRMAAQWEPLGEGERRW